MEDYHNEFQWNLNKQEYERTGKVRCHCCGGFLTERQVKSELEAFGEILFEEVECKDCINPYIGLNRPVLRKDFTEYSEIQRFKNEKYEVSEEEYYTKIDEIIEITNNRNKYLDLIEEN